MPVTLITPPTFEPLTLVEAKAHLRVTHSAEDGLIGSLITVAYELSEQFTQRAICQQTREYSCNQFPGLTGGRCPIEIDSATNQRRIELPWPRVSSVTSVKYIDSNGIEQTLASTEYKVSAFDSATLLTEAYGKTWPTARREQDAVKVRYVTGWATADDVPKSINQAMLLAIGYFYENREDAEAPQLPTVSQCLLKPYQIMGF